MGGALDLAGDLLLAGVAVVVAAVVAGAVLFVKRAAGGGGGAQRGDRASAPAAPQAAQQLAVDIKATATSTVKDQVAVMRDLASTQPGYRQYCELAGSVQAGGGVTAPYSKRQVAYYDVRCYRVGSSSGTGVETLVAHESSALDPFYFTDASCDTKIYVDLASFGANCMLVNSRDHIEGPGSDFSKAFEVQARQQANAVSPNAALSGFSGGGRGPDAAGMLLGVGLGALLAGMAVSGAPEAEVQTSPTQSFRGYRIVEDVVPLGQPVYVLGQLYQNGDKVYMGASVDKDRDSSFFATKPEAEVLHELQR